jgi:hypothetical protein
MSFREINRQALQDDEKVQRLMKMKIIEMETKENAPRWKEQQMLRFPQALAISNVPTLAQIISDEQTESSMNEEMLYQRAEAKLQTIAPKTSVEFILDRLTRQDLFYLNNSWEGILKKIREEYSTKGLDKLAFIGIIKSKSKRFYDVDILDKEDAIGLTNRGENRKFNVQAQIEELQNKIDEQNARYDQETADFETKLLTDEADRKAKKQQEEDDLDKAEKTKKIKKFLEDKKVKSDYEKEKKERESESQKRTENVSRR